MAEYFGEMPQTGLALPDRGRRSALVAGRHRAVGSSTYWPNGFCHADGSDLPVRKHRLAAPSTAGRNPASWSATTAAPRGHRSRCHSRAATSTATRPRDRPAVRRRARPSSPWLRRRLPLHRRFPHRSGQPGPRPDVALAGAALRRRAVSADQLLHADRRRARCRGVAGGARHSSTRPRTAAGPGRRSGRARTSPNSAPPSISPARRSASNGPPADDAQVPRHRRPP